MKTILYIQGMHCVSCEMLVQKELKKIPGIQVVSLSHKSGKLEISHEKALPWSHIQKAVQGLGYTVSKETSNNQSCSVTAKKNTFDDYVEMVAIAFAILIAFMFLRKLDITRFIPDIQNNVGIAVAVMLGVIASFSTCLALVGGIVMSFGSSYPVKADAKHPFLSRALPHVYFHIGRIGGFILLGGLLGLIGSTLTISTSFTGIFTLFVAAIMLYIGLQILGIVPSITKLGFHLPKSLSMKLHHLQESNHPLAPMMLGMGTFFIPCGFTQSMQLAAIASGSIFTGGMIMGAFALGTLPALFSLGLGSTYAQKSKSDFFHKAVGVFIALFAMYSFSSGFVLAGFSLPSISTAQESTTGVTLEDGVQVVKMDVDWGFSPNMFSIKKDIPVRWEINGINISGCVNSIVIPKLGIEKNLILGKNVVEFTPTETGVLPFSCWMGMVTGKFLVTE